MFVAPIPFQDFLSRNNYIDEIYDAMSKDDLSQVVMKAMDILRKTKNLPPLLNIRKSDDGSTQNRNAGNNAFKAGSYQRALILYNQALLTAPKNSKAMVLAYSNRSALFNKLQLWKQCETDIDKCFALGCPPDIVDKLTKRKESITPSLATYNITKHVVIEALEKCFSYNLQSHHPQIPSASTNVDFITNGMPEVVASTDIKIGGIVASEKAYICCTVESSSLYSCHYCQKKSLNLIPCDDCCCALFCDDVCKNACFKEYHVYECKIMEVIRCFASHPTMNLMVKASLKLRTLCKSWKELITASYNTGIEKIKTSTIQEIYDVNNIFSILSFKDDKPFADGIIYNASFVCAAVLHYLDEQGTFFPTNNDKKLQAMQALGRIMMYLSVYEVPLYLVQAQCSIQANESNFGVENFGLFPFIGKLKKSCKPNLIMLNNNNKLVLKAIRSINCGEELTISYLWNRNDTDLTQARHVKTFLFHGTVCNCLGCTGSYSLSDNQLSDFQKMYLSRLNMGEIDEKLKNNDVIFVYKRLLQALEVLKNVPHSESYIAIYRVFRKCLLSFELVYTENIVLDNKI